MPVNASSAPLLNLRDYAALARERWSPALSDWYGGGAADEITLAENEEAWARRRLRPRVLADVSSCDTATTLLGRPVALPIATAPCSVNAMAHPDGELAVARAAAAAGALQILSTGSGYSLEEVARTGPALRWFQLYAFKDWAINRDLLARAEAAGYAALCLTVDAPVDGLKERYFRSRLPVPPAGVALGNLTAYPNGDFGLYPEMTWASVEKLRGLTRLPLVLKGILAPEDIPLALASGAQGVVVSNHGGRQLDTALATADALAAIADQAAGRIEIYVDGGIRRGTDVLKALALGARAVLVGRPYLWGLTAGGEAGVRRVLDLLQAELKNAMALCGCNRLSAVRRSLLA